MSASRQEWVDTRWQLYSNHNSGVDVAESIAKKCRNETEELKVARWCKILGQKIWSLKTCEFWFVETGPCWSWGITMRKNTNKAGCASPGVLPPRRRNGHQSQALMNPWLLGWAGPWVDLQSAQKKHDTAPFWYILTILFSLSTVSTFHWIRLNPNQAGASTCTPQSRGGRSHRHALWSLCQSRRGGGRFCGVLALRVGLTSAGGVPASATPAAPRAAGQVLSAKGRPAPRRDSLRSSRQRLDGSQPKVTDQMCINFKMFFVFMKVTSKLTIWGIAVSLVLKEWRHSWTSSFGERALIFCPMLKISVLSHFSLHCQDGRRDSTSSEKQLCWVIFVGEQFHFWTWDSCWRHSCHLTGMSSVLSFNVWIFAWLGLHSLSVDPPTIINSALITQKGHYLPALFFEKIRVLLEHTLGAYLRRSMNEILSFEGDAHEVFFPI